MFSKDARHCWTPALEADLLPASVLQHICSICRGPTSLVSNSTSNLNSTRSCGWMAQGHELRHPELAPTASSGCYPSLHPSQPGFHQKQRQDENRGAHSLFTLRPFKNQEADRRASFSIPHMLDATFFSSSPPAKTPDRDGFGPATSLQDDITARLH